VVVTVAESSKVEQEKWSGSKEGHDGEGSAVTCSRTSMVWAAKRVGRS
jgi:hypothetical protein